MKALIFLLTISAISMWATIGLDTEPSVGTESGKVLSRIGRMLILADREEKTNRTFDIPASAQIMIDGEPGKLESVETGDFVVLTLTPDRKVTKVEAKSGKVKYHNSIIPLHVVDAERH